MEIIQKIIKLIDKRCKLDNNDDFNYSEIRKEEFLLLTKNLDETICVLNNLDSNHYFYISENFEMISTHFKSKELIECMKRNAIRTGVDCSVDIDYAIRALND